MEMLMQRYELHCGDEIRGEYWAVDEEAAVGMADMLMTQSERASALPRGKMESDGTVSYGQGLVSHPAGGPEMRRIC